MGELAIMLMIIVVLSIVSILYLAINNNQVNNRIVYLIFGYSLLLGWIRYTAVPDNYIIEKIIGIILIGIPIIAITMKSKNFKICKLLLGFSIIISTLIILFL